MDRSRLLLGRSDASRDRAVSGRAVSYRRALKPHQEQSFRPLKGAGNFLLSEATKESHQRKVLLLARAQARTIGADAGMLQTGHPWPACARPASLRAALRVFN